MIYIVTYEIHRDCMIHSMACHVQAKNAKEACAAARMTRKGKGYMFHVHGTRSRVQDENLLCVKTWKGTEVKGPACLDAHLCTDSRAWRINGRNLYA